jgi:hypothetical protein
LSPDAKVEESEMTREDQFGQAVVIIKISAPWAQIYGPTAGFSAWLVRPRWDMSIVNRRRGGW